MMHGYCIDDDSDGGGDSDDYGRWQWLGKCNDEPNMSDSDNDGDETCPETLNP